MSLRWKTDQGLEEARCDSANSKGLSTIEPELELIQVELKVFPVDGAVVGADPATFEEGKSEVSMLEGVDVEMVFLLFLLVVLMMPPGTKGLRTEAPVSVSCDF